jgi:metal-responsive CopG/Arc/MetJ family transcriptional regulator
MKEKTSISLSRDVLTRIDRLAGTKYSRSELIERVLRRYLRDKARNELHMRDLERINSAASRLNAEAADVLDFQSLEQQ